MDHGLVSHDPASGQDLEPPLLDEGSQLGLTLLRGRLPPLGQGVHLGPGESHVSVDSLKFHQHCFLALKMSLRPFMRHSLYTFILDGFDQLFSFEVSPL